MNTLNTTPSTNGSKSVLDGKNGRNKLDNRFDRRQLMRSSNRLERMAALRRNMYDIDYEKDIILDTQKCQRNYDLSKKIEPEYRDYFLWLAANAPSKQHEGYYDVYWSDKREVIAECAEYTWGCSHDRIPPSTWRNSQQNASMYILFVAKEPTTQLNCNADGTLKSNAEPARWENAICSVGIAIGMILRAAQGLGFVTGCNKSHNDLNGNDWWPKKLGIYEDVIKKVPTKRITFGIGIGFPNEGRPRWETDQTELLLGAGNGSKLTTDPKMKTHPRTGKKMRAVKLVDITKHQGEIIEDYYGNKHIIPTNADIKINGSRNRGINLIEIK